MIVYMSVNSYVFYSPRRLNKLTIKHQLNFILGQEKKKKFHVLKKKNAMSQSLS